jgi:hypothetical protein
LDKGVTGAKPETAIPLSIGDKPAFRVRLNRPLQAWSAFAALATREVSSFTAAIHSNHRVVQFVTEGSTDNQVLLWIEMANCKSLHDQHHINVDVLGQRLVHLEGPLLTQRIKAATIMAYMGLENMV